MKKLFAALMVNALAVLFITSVFAGGFTGTYATEWGDVVFTRNGNAMTGHYPHDKGVVQGVLNGNVLSGTWSESPSYKPPQDAGSIEFTFSPDGFGFTGVWRYGFTGAWKGKWNGKKTRPTGVSALNITGIYATAWGDVVFTQKGNEVTGGYPHDKGRIQGKLTGNELNGTWSESPTYKPPNDAGSIRFTFTPDGSKFNGVWRYGYSGAWKGKWDGTRKP